MPLTVAEVLMSLDGVLYGSGANDYVARITGDGNGGPDLTTGWQPFTVNVGALGVGTHTITIGGYNNKKTYNDESTVVLIDDVVVTGSALNNPPVAEDDVYGVNEDQSLVIDASTGVQIHTLTPNDGPSGAGFGDTLAIDGNIAIVGAKE